MILKASQRGGAADLATHLMKSENEHVLVHQLSGFASNDLKGAFGEAEAISQGTACRQFLFSLSLSPPEQECVAPEVFERAIDRIEERLGLQGQPRAIVFHEKEGRRHAHAVWSRIDAETMTARQMSFFKTKLKDVSRELYLENGWSLPRGLANAAEKNQTNFTLADWQQAKRQGVDPRWIKQEMQQCWAASDNRKSFERAIGERGYFLAKGDKRGIVVLGHTGEVHALSRTLELKTKDVRARLGDGDDLKSVAQTQQEIAARMTPALKEHIKASRLAFEKRSASLAHTKMEMTHLHRKERAVLETKLADEWNRETKERQARMPRGFKAIWSFFSGKTAELRRQNESEAKVSQLRQAQERQSLIDRQLSERRVLQAEFKDLRSRQAAQLLELRRDIGRYFQLSKTHHSARAAPDSLQRQAGLRLKLEP